MMGRRMGRPGLVGMAARTAVVAGTATAVSGGVARRQNARAEAKAQEQYDAQQQQQQYAAPPAPAPAAPAEPEESTEDLIAQLKKLGDLKEAGVLDEAEFQTAKAKLLAQM
jgi:coenzyme F420-reducing hydrogenase gamma subunit